MFQRILLCFQVFYFCKNFFHSQEMAFEQYLVLGYFIALVNCGVFSNQFTLLRPKRGVLMLALLFGGGVFYLFQSRRFLFLEVTGSDLIWIMHSFMFYSIFYLIFFVLAMSVVIILFVLLSTGILFYNSHKTSGFVLAYGKLKDWRRHRKKKNSILDMSYQEYMAEHCARFQKQDNCSICLVDFEQTDTLTYLKVCSHIFHSCCLKDWLDKKWTCPNCRVHIVQ